MRGAIDPGTRETIVRFLVGTFIGFIEWWMGPENEQLPPETVDRAYRALVLPGIANVLGLEIEIPRGLQWVEVDRPGCASICPPLTRSSSG